MIEYIQADLISLALNDYEYKLHACNGRGRWGRGIALGFREAYKKSYEEYQVYCLINKSNSVGTSLITSEKVICLISSYNYDPPDAEKYILLATKFGLGNLMTSLAQDAHVYSNRFNSGLFNVPWEKTETLINEFLQQRPDITWTVCDQ